MSEYLIKYFLKILRAWRTKINIEVIPDIIMFKLICNYTILKNCKMQFVARTIHFSCLTKVSGIFRINTLRSIMFLFNQNIWLFTYIFLIFFILNQVYVYALSPPTFEGERHRLYCTEKMKCKTICSEDCN